MLRIFSFYHVITSVARIAFAHGRVPMLGIDRKQTVRTGSESALNVDSSTLKKRPS